MNDLESIRAEIEKLKIEEFEASQRREKLAAAKDATEKAALESKLNLEAAIAAHVVYQKSTGHLRVPTVKAYLSGIEDPQKQAEAAVDLFLDTFQHPVTGLEVSRDGNLTYGFKQYKSPSELESHFAPYMPKGHRLPTGWVSRALWSMNSRSYSQGSEGLKRREAIEAALSGPPQPKGQLSFDDQVRYANALGQAPFGM